MRLLIFILACVALSPIFALGLFGYMFRLLVLLRPRGINGTTYEPFTGRLLMHDGGERPDPVAARLAQSLTLTAPPMWDLFRIPFTLAVRVSGYMPRMFEYPARRPAGPMAMLTVRTEFFDRTLREALDRVEQVVVLGAGWDTRAYSLPAGPQPKFFELDEPVTQQAKIDALARSGVDASNVTFVGVDFNRQSWLDALAQTGFNPMRPTYLLWEGVSMYLDEHVIHETLKAVAGLAPGSMIAFDYMPKELLSGEGLYGFVGSCFKASIWLTYGEQFSSGLPTRPIARQAIGDIVEADGLVLADFDLVAYGERYPIYGLALAEV